MRKTSPTHSAWGKTSMPVFQARSDFGRSERHHRIVTSRNPDQTAGAQGRIGGRPRLTPMTTGGTRDANRRSPGPHTWAWMANAIPNVVERANPANKSSGNVI